MYTSFYNLEKKPFQISSDPAFMWFGEKHKEALATLKYGILDNKGFLLLTGDVGTGKTTLINALIQSLSNDIICASVPDPGLEKMDFFNFIAAAFDIEEEFETKGKFLACFRNFLIQANGKEKKVLLIIDEAQLLSQEMLEEIRLLSNIERMDTKLINIFFVGQNEFNEILNKEQNRAVRQRLTLNYNIDPLTPDETADYIDHRLKIAGAKETIFDISATQEVFMYSGGFPRRINVICDHSLLSGYVNEQLVITADIVKECARELKIPAYIQNRNINGLADYHERKPPYDQSPQLKNQPSLSLEPEKSTVTVKSRPSFFLIVVIIVMLVACGWFFFISKDFSSTMDNLEKRVKTIRKTIAGVTPEPLSEFFNYHPAQTDQAEDTSSETPVYVSSNNVSGQPEISSQGETLDSKADPIPDEKKNSESEKKGELPEGPVSDFQPIQADVLNKESAVEIIPEQSLPHMEDTSSGNNHSSDTNLGSTETQVADENNVVKKSEVPVVEDTIKITPLPKEKVTIRFKYNTNDFTEEGYSKLMSYSEILAQHPESKVLVSGYTDSEGYKKYNYKLSEFRANIVKSFLLGRGIQPEQVNIKGRGSENPIESNATAWGRMMNRRVEIELVD